MPRRSLVAWRRRFLRLAETKRLRDPQINQPYRRSPQIVVRHDRLPRHRVGIEGAELCEDNSGAREGGGKRRAVVRDGVAVEIGADGEVVRLARRAIEIRTEL